MWFGRPMNRKRGTVEWIAEGRAGTAIMVRVKADGGRSRTVNRADVALIDPPRAVGPAPMMEAVCLDLPEGHGTPKKKTTRSPRYLAWIRLKPCAYCYAAAPSEAAHYGGKGASGGTGLKASDLFTVPLCHGCHVTFHAAGSLAGATVEQTRTLHLRWERDLLAEYLETGKAI